VDSSASQSKILLDPFLRKLLEDERKIVPYILKQILKDYFLDSLIAFIMHEPTCHGPCTWTDDAHI
jgi:hypothetical protein